MKKSLVMKINYSLSFLFHYYKGDIHSLVALIFINGVIYFLHALCTQINTHINNFNYDDGRWVIQSVNEEKEEKKSRFLQSDKISMEFFFSFSYTFMKRKEIFLQLLLLDNQLQSLCHKMRRERKDIFKHIFYSQIAASVDVRKNRMTISSYFSFFLMSYHAIQDLTLILKDESRKIFFSACSPHTKSSPTIQYNFSFLTFPMYTKCDFDSLPICIM